MDPHRGLRAGALHCWGRSNAAQTGQGNTTDLDTPTQVGGDADWTAVAAGSSNTCALKGAGDLYCWGSNALGLNGDDATPNPTTTPRRVGTASDWTTLDQADTLPVEF